MATNPRTTRRAPRSAPATVQSAERTNTRADSTRASRRETTDARVIRGLPLSWFCGAPARGETR